MAIEGQPTEELPSIALMMLSKDQQKKLKISKRENSKKEEATKALDAMEAFLSDKEAYVQLTPA